MTRDSGTQTFVSERPTIGTIVMNDVTITIIEKKGSKS
jgi:hypothetical protein